MSEHKEFEAKMKKTCEALNTQLAGIRAGRANAAVLDQIQVEYYGSMSPIQQVASVSSPDPRSLVIQPWDKSLLKGIEKAILSSELGINPQNDGICIRLVFPPLTEERRKDLVKQTKKYGEDSKVAIRNIRRDAPPWRRAWQPTPVFLSGKSHEQRSLAATVHGVAKSRTQLSDRAHSQN